MRVSTCVYICVLTCVRVCYQILSTKRVLTRIAHPVMKLGLEIDTSKGFI